MPLLRTETVHGVVCKSYDGDIVKVGTTAAGRFTIKVPSDEEAWFPTRLRAELVKRELAIAAELAVDETDQRRTDEAAMAAKAAAAKEEADKRAAWKQAVAEDRACPKQRRPWKLLDSMKCVQKSTRCVLRRHELALVLVLLVLVVSERLWLWLVLGLGLTYRVDVVILLLCCCCRCRCRYRWVHDAPRLLFHGQHILNFLAS